MRISEHSEMQKDKLRVDGEVGERGKRVRGIEDEHCWDEHLVLG